ncbi:MAG: FAD-dependent thymidylate synthase [Brevefilum sp.]
MNRPRRIYLLSPQDLSPETIAVAFAKTSRSPKPFDEIASELSDDRAARFHEKWVVGYGHSSVAEHAVLHIAIENISRLAIETIEGNRLASYTEKSTRYQQWEGDAFFVPEEIRESHFRDEYVETCHGLFQAYQLMMPAIKNWLRQNLEQDEAESEKSFQRRIQSEAADVCRFLLPAASLANVGVTINARSLEYAICKMLSTPLSEVQSIGEHLREVGQREAPTLIKYADCNEYLIGVREKMRKVQPIQSAHPHMMDLSLIDWDRNGQEKILAGVLFRFCDLDGFQSVLDYVKNLSSTEQRQLADDIMEDRSRFDQPLREFEYPAMTFESVMDQGAYFEFKRHRMMTQTVGPLTVDLGYAIPETIVQAGCLEVYQKAMVKTVELFDKIAAWNPDVASYIVPNGFNRRVLFSLNLREAFHFCRLRAANNAHFSIRRIALQMAEKIHEIYPLFASYLDIPNDQTSQDISDRYFSELNSGV